jgi:hypothetical protein
MSARWFALLVIGLGGCYDAAYVLVHLDAAAGTPPIAQLRVTTAEGALSDMTLVPASPASLTFPTTFTLKLPSSAQGNLGVSIDARDASGTSVASAYGVSDVHGAGRSDLYLTLGPLCTDTTTVQNCGACGRACATTNTTALACSSSVCTPSCSAGFLDCIHPAAPAPDDGCESVPCTGNTCPNKHSDGLSPPHFFYDCAPLGTFDHDQAVKACKAAMTGDACTMNTFTCSAMSVAVICRTSGGVCYCWAYTGDGFLGHVHSAASCECPLTTDPSWS